VRKKLVDKQLKKHIDGKCAFCPVNNYDLLDVHRVIPGATYEKSNVLTVCSNCHRLIHSGAIKVLGKHLCTNGRYLVQFIENNEEKFLEI